MPQKTEVWTLIVARLPATLLLMAAGIVGELVIGLTLRHDRRRHAAAASSTGCVMMASFVGVSAPQFVVGAAAALSSSPSRSAGFR